MATWTNPATGEVVNTGTANPGSYTTSTTNKRGVTTFTNHFAPSAPTPQPEAQQNPATGGINYDQQKALDEANARAAMDLQLQQQQYEREVRQRQALETVQAAFEQYGLSSLYPKIEEYAKAGYSSDIIILKLRETPEYKARFPAMDALSKKGRAISEAAYVDYEKTAAALEQRYGLPKGMVMGSVTDLLTAEVSAAELNDRIALASASSLEASPELRDTLSNYYGLNQGDLAAFFLDPDKAMPLLQKQYAAAKIGSFAVQQGLSGVDATASERLTELGVSEQQAQEGFGRVKYTEQFGTGKGETANQQTRIDATLAGNASAAQKVERVKTGRVNRFAGGGQYAGDRTGVSALGSSNA